MECVVCDGTGCDECGGAGTFDIAACPLTWMDYKTRQFIDLAELYLDHGLPPIAGGSLDQTVSFIDGALYVNQEANYWKRKLGIIDG